MTQSGYPVNHYYVLRIFFLNEISYKKTIIALPVIMYIQ